MIPPLRRKAIAWGAVLIAGVLPFCATALADDDDGPKAQALPNTGQLLTPLAPHGARFEPLNPGLPDFPDYVVGQAVSTVESPDHKTLLILTSGYNILHAAHGPDKGKKLKQDSNEYVFVYDISSPTPRQRQVLQVPNTYNGVAFDPSGKSFYVAGGDDDNVHIFSLGQDGHWAEDAGSPVALGHQAGVGIKVKPEAAGLAVTQSGTKLVVADYYNDAVSVLTKTGDQWSKSAELDLRPGKIDPNQSGVPGGEYPFWVVIKGDSTAYISSIRDREIDVVSLEGTPKLMKRIKVKGQPNKMALNAAGDVLYAAEDETDSVAVVNTASNSLVREVPVGAPAGILPSSRARYTGNNTNSVTLTPDGNYLYVTNGNTNDIAVVDVSKLAVIGLIPTGWYPNSVSFSADGKYVYVVNGKSPTGPNRGFCHPLTPQQEADCRGSNEYGLQLIKAGFQSFPTPTVSQLSALTQQVSLNNHFMRKISAAEAKKMAELRSKIKHVIYIIKENRTYDEVLGDLEEGNGDPELTEFGASITPNLHHLAGDFVDLDNFYDSSEVSMGGWAWSTSARAPDVVEKEVTVNYAGRGLSYETEGTNRDVNVAYGTLAERRKANPLTPDDPDVLPGQTDVAAPDGPNDEVNEGYVWNQALRAKLSVRNYGFFIDLTRYGLKGAHASEAIPETIDPAATHTTVAYCADVALRPYTDPYFRGFDNAFPDYYRFKEWEREFDTKYAQGGLPQLSLVRFMHDHTGDFSTAIKGVNTVKLQEADNDYAVGLLIQKIAHSRYKDDTLVFVIEDDSQDGGDHVDSHRSIAFIAGPYVKHHAVVSTAYNTIAFVRTMEEIMGLKPLNLNDSTATPMADAFDLSQKTWDFTAQPSAILYNTQLPLPKAAAGLQIPKSAHDAAYWAAATKGMDFSVEDRIDFHLYNHILWQGLMGDKPYPESPSGLDLRKNRAALLERHKAAGGVSPANY